MSIRQSKRWKTIISARMYAKRHNTQINTNKKRWKHRMKKQKKKKEPSRASTSVWTALVKTRCRFLLLSLLSNTNIYLRRNALTVAPPYFPKPVHEPRLANVVTRRRCRCCFFLFALSLFSAPKFVFIFHDLCIAHALSPRAQFTHLIIIKKETNRRTFHARFAWHYVLPLLNANMDVDCHFCCLHWIFFSPLLVFCATKFLCSRYLFSGSSVARFTVVFEYCDLFPFRYT